MSAQPFDLFRRLTNGVYVVGVAHEGRANAFTAAWITQVSFDPPLLALSINPEHASYPLLLASRAFTVNVLSEGQTELARHFGTRSGRDLDKLAGIRTRRGKSEAPFLMEAAAYIECRVVGTMPAGDHELVVGRAIDGDVLAPDAAPLRYLDTGDLDGGAALYPPHF
jgi:flavin reductase (DIM6/NTAB) family NADH-FMN oxidoreductase RutF